MHVDDRVLAWGTDSLRALAELAGQPGTGVRLATGDSLSDTDHTPPPWFDLLRPAPARGAELRGYRFGTRCTAPLLDMPTHLGYLQQRLHAAGGGLRRRHVTSLDSVRGGAQVVLHCAGAGAARLAEDSTLIPVRGQHLVLTNPHGLTDFVEVDTGTSPDLVGIYPHPDRIVLAGTAEPGVVSTTPDARAADAIRARCTAIEPRLANSGIIAHLVGLRPGRPSIRLELLPDPGDGGARVVHHYGHGGAGVSLAWGCAHAAHDLVTTL